MMAVIPIMNLLKQPQLWRYVGFISSMIGVLCYALSSSFEHLFGEWNLLKIFLYGVMSFIICTFMLFANKWQLSSSLVLKAHVGFLVLMVTSVYSFFYDKAVKGKADVLGLISCAAFAFMSFSLSRQIELGFEVDLLNFFIGCLTVQLMKIHLVLASVGAVFCYFLILLRSSLDSQAQQIGTVTITDHIAVQVDAENGLEKASESDHGSNIESITEDSTHQQNVPSLHKSNSTLISGDNNHQQELPSLRKRKTAQKLIKLSPTLEDDHSWRKYGQKEILGSKFPRSYFRCTQKYDQGCLATKQVQRVQTPDMYQITYFGNHTCKDTLKAPHLVIGSFNRESSLMNAPPDSKVPNEQDHPISSINSSSIIEQEYPKGDTPSDLIDYKLDPSQRSDMEDFEVSKPAIMALDMASDNSDTVYSFTSSQNLDVNFRKDDASTHNNSNNED